MPDEPLKPCPCGETPNAVGIEADSIQKWAFVYGDCCSEWYVEFRTEYNSPTSPECLALATEAWNEAPRKD